MKSKKCSVFISILFSFFAFSQERTVFEIAKNGTVEEMMNCYNTNPNLLTSLNERNSSPLVLACYYGNQEVALFLIDKVASDSSNPERGTPLMAAVMSGNLAIVQKLLTKNPNLNQVDSQGKTALIYASYLNNTEVAKSLIAAGADKSIKAKDATSALDYAVLNKNTELIILLN